MNGKRKSIIFVFLIVASILIFIRKVDKSKDINIVENKDLENLTYEDIHKFYTDKILVFASENNLETETVKFYENKNLLDKNTGNLKYNNIEILVMYNLNSEEEDTIEIRKDKMEKIVARFDEEVLNSEFIEFEKIDKFHMEIMDVKYNIYDGINYMINSGNVLGYPNMDSEDENFEKIKDIVNCEILEQKGLLLQSLGRDRETSDYLIILDARDVKNQEKIKNRKYKNYKKISDNIYESLKKEELHSYIKDQNVYNLKIIFKGECNSNRENKEFIYEI